MRVEIETTDRRRGELRPSGPQLSGSPNALAGWCECLVLAERHADKASREVLTMRTGPAPQSWLR